MCAYNLKLASVLALLVVAVPGVAQNGAGPALNSDSFSINTRTGRVEFVRGVITYGDFRITADAGSYIDNEEWRFDGNLELTSAEMRISGDSLVGSYLLNDFEITGSPISFEATTDAGQAAQGEAQRLIYDGDTREVALLGKSRLRVGPYELSGCDIRFGLVDGDLRTGEECEERFELRSQADEAGEANDEADDANDAPAAPAP